MKERRIWLAGWLSCATLLFSAGCGGSAAPAPSQPAPITVTVSASSTALGSGETSTLTAVVANDSQGVVWTVPAGSPGTLTTVDALHATYAAGTVTQPGTIVVTATSKTDPTKSASVTITLANTVAVSVTPATSDIGAGQTVTLSASVANDAQNKGVTWSLRTGAAGTLSNQTTTGVTYTAPAAVSTASTDVVTATSVADQSATAAATINLHPASVALGAPATDSVGPLQTSLLSANVAYAAGGVTWSTSTGTITGLDSGCGGGASCCPQGACKAIYSAPPEVSSDTSVTITAALVSDPTKTASANIQLTAPATPAWEGLVAFDNGRNLHALKPYADLERGAVKSGVYQPDRMIFHEEGLGTDGNPLATEIWQLDNDTPPVVDAGDWPIWVIPGTLNRTPWNANGSYFELSGTVCSLEIYCHTTTDPHNPGGPQISTHVGDAHNYLFSGDGSMEKVIMPTAAGTAETVMASGEYLPWDKVNPSLFYVVTDGSNFVGATPNSALYVVDVSQDFSMTKLVDLPLPMTVDPVTHAPFERSIQSYLSENDIVMVTDDNPPDAGSGSPDYIPNIYMVDANPGHTTYKQIVAQFPINFSGLVPPPTTCPQVLCIGAPFDPNDEYHLHDIYFQRDNADHFIFNFGPKGDVGEGVFWQASADGSSALLAYPDPTGTPYMGHPAFNFDGTQVAYGGYDTLADNLQDSSVGVGNWVRSVGPDGRLNDGSVTGNTGTLGVGHQGWDGYDRHYVVFDGYSTVAPGGNVCGPQGDAMWSEMSGDPTSMSGTFRVLVDDGMRNNEAVATNAPGCSEPSIINGPAQSPDATKMMFSMPETFTTASPFDVFLAVDHRPFPPTLSAVSGGAGLDFTITPNPDHPHREVAGYHLYVSSDGKSFTEVATGSNTTAYDSIPADPSQPVTVSVPAPTGTAEYAVTAQEFSGLESSELSNLVQVSGGAINSNFAPAGTTNWDTTTTPAVAGFSVCRMTAPQGSAGAEWKLTWSADADIRLRYFNIYYSGGGIPQITNWQDAQNYLVASPSADETSYIYWQANPSDVPAFGIVAVDRQDQPSTPVYVQTTLVPNMCGN